MNSQAAQTGDCTDGTQDSQSIPHAGAEATVVAQAKHTNVLTQSALGRPHAEDRLLPQYRLLAVPIMRILPIGEAGKFVPDKRVHVPMGAANEPSWC